MFPKQFMVSLADTYAFGFLMYTNINESKLQFELDLK